MSTGSGVGAPETMTRVTEHRLTEALVRERPGRRLADTNPIAAMIVESSAATHPEQAERIRTAGRFLCDLLRPGDGDATALTLPVAMHTFVREEHTTPAQMRRHLAQTTARDLLLGVAAHALLAQPRPRDRREAGEESEPVLRTVYLLVRMHEVQEEIDTLEHALDV